MKRLTMILLALTAVAMVLVAQSLSARIDGGQLRLTSSRMRFLTGEAMDRLRDGATVRYAFQLTARENKDGRILARTQQQFAISYDLWEEKFAVTKLGSAPRSISHLSASAAEAWCVDNTSVPVAALGATPTIWLRLDYQVNDPTEAPAPPDNSALTLSGLIDIFSRRTREQLRGSEEVGPLRLESLKKR